MSNPHSRMMSRVLPRSSRQLTSRGVLPRKTFSATDRSGTIIECWKTVAIHSRQRADVTHAGRGRAAEPTVPASGSRRPDRIETTVDFPAPLRPTRPRHWPAREGQVDPAQGAGGTEPLLDTGHLNERRAA